MIARRRSNRLRPSEDGRGRRTAVRGYSAVLWERRASPSNRSRAHGRGEASVDPVRRRSAPLGRIRSRRSVRNTGVDVGRGPTYGDGDPHYRPVRRGRRDRHRSAGETKPGTVRRGVRRAIPPHSQVVRTRNSRRPPSSRSPHRPFEAIGLHRVRPPDRGDETGRGDESHSRSSSSACHVRGRKPTTSAPR